MIFKNSIKISPIHIAVIILIGALLIFGGVTFAARNSNTKRPSSAIITGSINGQNGNSNGSFSSESSPPTLPDPALVSNSQETTKSLIYMIEEEKLAHDVYQVMYEKWGSRVFGNILKSELSHQNQILVVMQNRTITDPRSTQIGVFNNPDLQALYNKLIAQGSQNVTEAIKVGVAIEELDISDLKTAISKLGSADTDVKSTYDSLLSGSQRHLSAFNRQLTR